MTDPIDRAEDLAASILNRMKAVTEYDRGYQDGLRYMLKLMEQNGHELRDTTHDAIRWHSRIIQYLPISQEPYY